MLFRSNVIQRNLGRRWSQSFSALSQNKNVNLDQEEALSSLSDYELPTNTNNENLLRIRHSSAHIMAMAVQKLFPKTKTAIGPWTDNG